jgi:streptogramin lyase
MPRRLLPTLILTLSLALAALPGTAAAAPAVDLRADVSDAPGRMTLGPDGNIWFTLGGAKEFGRVTPGGTVTEYDHPGNVAVTGVTAGAPGKVWFAYAGGLLEWDIATATGTQHAIADITTPHGIARDADGNFWVVDGDDELVVADAAGAFVRKIAFPGAGGRDIVAGPDGRMWWVAFGSKEIIATPRDAVDATTSQRIPVGGNPQDLAAAPDGMVAYSNPDPPHRVGRLSALGVPLGESLTGAGTDPFGAAYGPDGAFWFAGFAADAAIRVDRAGDVTFVDLGAGSGPRRITAGAGPTLWVALEGAKQVARISGVEPPPPPPVPEPAPGGGPGAGGGPAAADVVAPVLSRLRLSATRFRVSPRPTAVSAQRRRRAIPAGTTVSFFVNEPAAVSLAVERRVAGRRRGRACVRPSRALRRARRCTRWVRVGTIRRANVGGRVGIRFTGRIGRRALRAGRYRFRITARDGAGNVSRPRTLRFTVVR